MKFIVLIVVIVLIAGIIAITIDKWLYIKTSFRSFLNKINTSRKDIDALNKCVEILDRRVEILEKVLRINENSESGGDIQMDKSLTSLDLKDLHHKQSQIESLCNILKRIDEDLIIYQYKNYKSSNYSFSLDDGFYNEKDKALFRKELNKAVQRVIVHYIKRLNDGQKEIANNYVIIDPELRKYLDE